MIIRRIVVGPLETNCYIVGDDDTHEAVIIDPGADPEAIKAELKSRKLTPKLIINTHGHGDHIGANGGFKLPVWIHRLDAGMLIDPASNLSTSFGLGITSSPASKLVEEGDEVPVGNLKLKVIHTPGHTEGGISLKVGDAVFTGDTIFREGVGRTDLPGGSHPELLQSIKTKLLKEEDNVKFYPGHGPTTTAGHERKNNPWIT